MQIKNSPILVQQSQIPSTFNQYLVPFDRKKMFYVESSFPPQRNFVRKRNFSSKFVGCFYPPEPLKLSPDCDLMKNLMVKKEAEKKAAELTEEEKNNDQLFFPELAGVTWGLEMNTFEGGRTATKMFGPFTTERIYYLLNNLYDNQYMSNSSSKDNANFLVVDVYSDMHYPPKKLYDKLKEKYSY